ncbi:RNA polymerase sigma factor [Lishizhenia sp.]|uniref:RNA polymerase sigma factor n=1 Tax=Lishizhenia sp. TaxID=2497594 RepID=UPI00299D1C11|nr:RNA polymerase sigma factor [Lishizhenia sp.]MDX1445084.1 RNA polymerase sigma factor [Lishizhenia sp.]
MLNRIKGINNYMHIDTELLIACAKNDRKAQKKLYEACYVFLMPKCLQYHKNEEDARAIFNKGFYKILKNLSKIDLEEVMFAAWSKRIMANTLIDDYRKNKNYKTNINVKDSDQELDYHASSSTNEAVNSFGQKDIMQLLEYLKPAAKQVFLMYVVEGYNHREIGEMLNMSEGTSKWHLSTARKELKERLEKLTEAELRTKVV